MAGYSEKTSYWEHRGDGPGGARKGVEPYLGKVFLEVAMLEHHPLAGKRRRVLVQQLWWESPCPAWGMERSSVWRRVAVRFWP